MACSKELLQRMVDDITTSDDERVRKAWNNGAESSIEHFKS